MGIDSGLKVSAEPFQPDTDVFGAGDWVGPALTDSYFPPPSLPVIDDTATEVAGGMSMAADTGATGHVLGRDMLLEGKVVDRKPLLKVINVITRNGTVEVTETGKVTIGGKTYEGWVMDSSGMSLLSVGCLCDAGWEYTQTRKIAALRRGSEWIHLTRRWDGLWMLEDRPDWVGGSMGPNPSQSGMVSSIDTAELGRALAVFQQEVEGFALTFTPGDKTEGGSTHTKRRHWPHDPKCRHCMAGRMQHRKKLRRSKRTVEGPGEGLKLSSDLMGPFEEELMGHLYSIMVVEDKFQWAEVGGLKDKAPKGSADEFHRLVREIARQTLRQGANIVRVHTDMGTEFKGLFESLCAKLGARHTGTGGYRSTNNPLGEGWNRIAMGTVRAALAACTGGEGYFRELWLLALVHAVYWINRTSKPDRSSPYSKVHGTEYVMHPHDHVFGSLCMYHVKDVDRANKGDRLAKPAIWVGRDTLIGGHRVVPISWDHTTLTWQLSAVESVVTCHVDEGNCILRKGPKQGAGHGMEAMDQFVDRYWPEEVDTLPDPLVDPVVAPVPVAAVDPGPGPGAAPGVPAGAHVPDPPVDPLAVPAPDGVI